VVNWWYNTKWKPGFDYSLVTFYITKKNFAQGFLFYFVIISIHVELFIGVIYFLFSVFLLIQKTFCFCI
jgi:hypothetical protein